MEDEARDDLSVGDVLLFFSQDGSVPPVVGTIGRIETGEEMGLGGEGAGILAAHLSIVTIPGIGADEPVRWSHAPFFLEALERVPHHRFGRGARPLDGFESGYADFRAALAGGGAGFFTISPADLVWATMTKLSEPQG